MRATTALAAAYRKLVGRAIFLGMLVVTASVAVGMPVLTTANAVSVQPVASAATKKSTPPQPVFVNKAEKPAKKVKKSPAPCKNDLIRTLRGVGFKGANLREAWAIAMRESHGQARVISSTWDVGLYQFNRAAHSGQKWWNVDKLRTAHYNAKVAFEMSEGGRTWYPWGLDGKGNVKAHIYRNIGWSDSKIESHIVAPFQKQLRAFDKLPATCRN